MDSSQEITNKYYDGDLGDFLHSKKNSTSIEIDFTGQELYLIAEACVELDITFSEFVDKTIKEILSQYKEKQIEA